MMCQCHGDYFVVSLFLCVNARGNPCCQVSQLQRRTSGERATLAQGERRRNDW
jgi:hypothetical protein